MATYTSLIGRVISDFDAIYDVLVEKGIVSASKKHDGTYKTEDYDSLISGGLTNIKGILEGAPDQIENYNLTGDSAVITSKTAGTSVVLDGTTHKLSFKGVSAGYYGDNSQFLAVIPVEDINVDTKIGSGLNATLTGTGEAQKYVYTITPSTGKVISTVSVDKGSVSVKTLEANVSDTSTFTTTDVLDNKGLAISDTATTYTNALEIEYTTTVNRAGKLTVNPTVAKTAGYITTNDVNVSEANYEKDFDGTHYTQTAKKLYIKRGTLSNIQLPSTTAASVSGAVAWVDPTATGVTSADYIVLSASISSKNSDGTTSNTLQVTGSLDAGYITGNSDGSINLGSVTVDAGQNYLKRGKVNAYTNTAATMTLTGNTLSEVKETVTDESKYHKLTVSSSTPNATGTIEAGYLEAGTYSVNASGSKDIYIAKGSATITAGATASITTGSGYFSTSSSDGIAVTITPSVTLQKNVTTGYVANTDIDIQGTSTNPAKTETPTTVYLKTGSATVTRSLSTSLVEAENDGAGGSYEGEGDNKKLVDIFETTLSAVSGRDYYVITSDAAVTSSSAGYMTGGDITFAGTAPVKYLPKADLEWVNTTDAEGNVTSSVLQVTKGGYLPSGILSNIDTTDSSLVKAEVGVIAGTGSSSIFSTDVIEGGYLLNLTKGKVSAGYISSAADEGSVTGSFYVAAGSVGVTATEAVTKAASVTAVEGEAGEDGVKPITGYTLSIESATTTTLNVGEGYVEHKNITLNNAVYNATNNKTLVTDTSKTVDLARAQLEMAEGSQAINLDIDVADGIETGTAEDSTYAITPVITGNSKVNIVAANDGYLTEGVGNEITILTAASAATQPVYIKKGGAVTIAETTTNTLTATPDFTDTVKDAEGKDTGYYKVTVGGALTVGATVPTGYYGAAEVSAAATGKTLEVTGTSIQIAKAVTSTQLTASAEVASEDITFASTTETGKKYAAISATVSASSVTTVATPGYVKETGEIAPTDKTTSITNATPVYIELYENATMELAAKDGENIPTAAATVVVPVANKYATTDVTVTIADNAMGMAVANKLTLLEQRLNGFSGQAQQVL